MIRFSTEKAELIDWDKAVEVFARAPLGKRRRELEKLQRAFAASYSICQKFFPLIPSPPGGGRGLG